MSNVHSVLGNFAKAAVVLFQLESWNSEHVGEARFWVSAPGGGTGKRIADHLSSKLGISYEQLMRHIVTLELEETVEKREVLSDVKDVIDFLLKEIDNGNTPPLEYVLEWQAIKKSVLRNDIN